MPAPTDPFQLDSTFIERCPRKQVRIRREHIRDLVAWLMVIGRRFERLYQSLTSDTAKLCVPGAVQSAAYARQSLRVIQHLVDSSLDKFDRGLWDEVQRELDAAFSHPSVSTADSLEGVIEVPHPFKGD